MSFPRTCRLLEAGQGGGWGCGPKQLAATVPCASVYSGCIAMARIHNIIRKHTKLLAVLCKYSRTLWVLQRESWSSIFTTIIAGLSPKLLKLLMCACAKQPAAHTHSTRERILWHPATWASAWTRDRDSEGRGVPPPPTSRRRRAALSALQSG